MANNYKKGAFSDDEKRMIEQLIKFDTYAAIAKKLNREPSAVRKYCQRKGITDDTSSIEKHIESKTRKSPHFEELNNILTDREMDLTHKIYTELMKQFGGDILPSEEIQVIDFCIVSAMLNRSLAREKEINRIMGDQIELRAALEKEKEKIEEDDEQDDWYDKIEQVDMRIQNLSDELKEVKKNQISFFGEKKKSTEAMKASRNQRADEISKSNENWSDFVYFLKKNPEFRKTLGYELESMRLGMKEEYIRLTRVHEYGDGELDHPILNSDVIENKSFADIYDKTLVRVEEIKREGELLKMEDGNEEIDWAAEVRATLIEKGVL
jgi:hypothetical protein